MKHLTFTEAVLARPFMYTIDGSFASVVAFLEGYYSGAAKGNPGWEPVLEWVKFESWLSDELNVHDLHSGNAFSRFGAGYSDDAQRVSEFRRMYRVFRRKYSASPEQALPKEIS